MTRAHLFAMSGIALVGIGLLGVVARRSLVRRVIALNFMASGVFLVIVALAARSTPADPVPHALVLTGVVVSFASTAFALALAVRLDAEDGTASAPDDRPGPGARRARDGDP